MATVVNERDVILINAIQRLETQAARDVSFAGRGVTLTGSSGTKPATALAGWNADVYSQQNSTGNAFCSAVAPASNMEVAFGLNQDPTNDASILSLDYAWHLHADGTVSIIESGTEIAFAGGTGGSAGGASGGSGGTGGTTSPPLVFGYYGTSFVWGWDGAGSGGQVATPVPAYVDANTDGATFRNEGVNSSSTTKTLNGTDGVHPTWTTQMANTSDDWIIIEFMLNDSYDLTVSQYQNNLTALYNAAVATGKKVIFQTIHYIDTAAIGDPEASGHLQGMLDTAAALGIHCINMWAYTKPLWSSSIRTYVPDGYHPTQAAYNVIGKYVVDQLVTFVPGLTYAAGVGTGGSTGTAYPQSGTIAYWGDSIVWGGGQDFNQVATPPVTTFDNDLANFTATNEGVTDNTAERTLNGTDTIHTDLATWLANHPRTYFICELGYNEEYIDGGTSVATYTSSLNTIVDTVRAAGAIMIFETWNETNIEDRVGPYRQAMRDVAANKGVPLIDQYTYLYDYRINNGLQLVDMYPNGYHPTQAVYDMKGHYAATRFKQIIGAA